VSHPLIYSYTVFDGPRRLVSGTLAQVAMAAKQAFDRGSGGPVLIFDDHTGRSRDIDMSGTPRQVVARLVAAAPRARGRPRLGVVAREVTLLPRHWEWLATQSGGASVALRRLVEDARRHSAGKDAQRQAHERAYHFMSAMAGDLPGYEEATRAMFAHDAAGFAEQIQAWPADVRDHARKLAFGGP
jgi:hypothetical protein